MATSISGVNNLFTDATGSFTSAFFKYVATNGSNTRAGDVLSAWNGSSAIYTDYSTVDIGSTAAVTASVAISGGNVQFNVQTNGSGWTIKSLVTYV